MRGAVISLGGAHLMSGSTLGIPHNYLGHGNPTLRELSEYLIDWEAH